MVQSCTVMRAHKFCAKVTGMMLCSLYGCHAVKRFAYASVDETLEPIHVLMTSISAKNP